MRCNFSLVARYSLKFTRCSLLVVRSLVTRCKICSLLVVVCSFVVTRCYLLFAISSFVICSLFVIYCRSCSLQKVARYSLQNSFVTRCRSCSLQKITCYSFQNSLVTRCRKLFVVKNHSTPTKKLNKDTIEISVISILPMYPLSHTLSRLLLPVQKPSR